MTRREYAAWRKGYIHAFKLLERNGAIPAGTVAEMLRIVAAQTERRVSEPVAAPDRRAAIAQLIESTGCSPRPRDPDMAVFLGPVPSEVYRLAVALPAIGAAAGDLIAWSFCGAPRVRGRAMMLTADGQRALRSLRWAGEAPEVGLVFSEGRPKPYLHTYLQDARRWGLSAKVWRSPVYLVKPYRPGATEGLAAPSDDAAIFELLARVGCAMPRPRRRRRT